jgi:hypothetical protein
MRGIELRMRNHDAGRASAATHTCVTPLGKMMVTTES